MTNWKLLRAARRLWPLRARPVPDQHPAVDPPSYARYDALMAQGDAAEAAAEMLRMVALRPDDAIANFRLGNHYARNSRPVEARMHHLRAASSEADGFGALLAKGTAARLVGMMAEAEAALRAAHALQPGHAHVGHQLGLLLLQADRGKDALVLLQEIAAACAPAVEVYEPCALALALNRQPEAAEEMLGRLAALYGADADRLFAFAQRADDHGATDLAKECCSLALAIADRADIRAYRDLLLPQVPSSQADLEARDAAYRTSVAALAASGLQIDPPPMWLGWISQIQRFFFARPDPALAEATARMCIALCPALARTAPHCAAWRSAPMRERLRIGVLVPSYYPLLWGVARELDRRRFTIVHFDPSPGAAPARAGWRDAAERRVSLEGLSLREAQDAIANEELDVILSEPANPLGYQLAHARLAPVQCTIAEPSWCDGFANLDYYIAWAHAEPRSPEVHYRSPLALLERPPYWLERDHCRPEAVSRSDFDLPADARWYVCAQSPQKVHVTFDRVLGQILDRDPLAVIVLLRGDWPPSGRLTARLRTTLGERAARVRFLPTLPPERCHGLLKIADAVIDSWPIGGMWSAFSAIQIGAPTVTLPADVPFGRWMTAMYERIGVTDLIARDEEHYVRLALRLAADPDWRRDLGARIAERHGVLVEDRQAVRGIEEFLLAAVAAAHRGEPPRTWRGGAFVSPPAGARAQATR